MWIWPLFLIELAWVVYAVCRLWRRYPYSVSLALGAGEVASLKFVVKMDDYADATHLLQAVHWLTQYPLLFMSAALLVFVGAEWCFRAFLHNETPQATPQR